MKYLLGGRRYEHLHNNDFKDCVTKEIINIFNIKHQKLMQRVEVGFTSEIPKKLHLSMYQKIRRLRQRKRQYLQKGFTVKTECTDYKIFRNTICFDGRTWIQIPKGKTADDIVNKYKDKIYGH